MSLSEDFSTSSQSTNPAENASGKSPGLVVAVGLAGAWILGLVTLAVLTSNPVTLNRAQILHADFVVTAKRTSADSNSLSITKEWKHGQKFQTVSVANLQKIDMPTEQDFLVPLERVGSEKFTIPLCPPPKQVPLIYPATPEAETQLKTLLESLPPQS